MSSAWNWLGIFVWLAIIAYFLFIIHNSHARKKRLIKTAMSNKKHKLSWNVSKNNFEITLFEVLILVVLLIGMGKTTRRHHVLPANSQITVQSSPITQSQTKLSLKHPNQKIHKYYVMIGKTKARNFKQKYHFAANGKKVAASSSNSILISNRNQLKHDVNLSHEAQKYLSKKSVWKTLGKDKPEVVQLSTVFKNNAGNGIGLHAGQKKFYYNFIKVPKKYKHGIYINTKKLQKKHKRIDRKSVV